MVFLENNLSLVGRVTLTLKDTSGAIVKTLTREAGEAFTAELSTLIDDTVFTQVESDFSIDLEVFNVEAVALLGLEAREVGCRVVNAYTDKIVYAATKAPFKAYFKNYTEYLANRFETQSELLFNFPYQKKATIIMSVKGKGTNAKCGKIVCGNFKNFGVALEGVKVSIEDFSRYERGADGRLYINVGKSVRSMSASCWVENENVSMFLGRLNSMRGKFGIFSVGEIMIYGIAKTNGVLCKRESKMLMDIEIEGAI